MSLYVWAGIAFFLLSTEVYAQNASVRGRVLDQVDEQPLNGASVAINNTETGQSYGTATDSNGFFLFPRLAPGQYVLQTSFVGYLAAHDTLTLGFNEKPTLTIHLSRDETVLGEVLVETEQVSPMRTGKVGLTTIRPVSLAQIPMPGLSADLAGYLQTLPGVSTLGDRGGQLFIRGGTPSQNLVLLDGIPLFQPFHIVGFYSAFPADLTAYTDVYTGGFGARYGGRLSSVINVAMRNGNKKRVAGSFSLAPFLGAAHVEIPIHPDRVSLMASVRESVIERLAPDLLGESLPYRFGDRIVKLHAFLNRTSSLGVTALHTFDEGDIANTKARPSSMHWENTAFGGHYTYLPEAYALLSRFSFFYSRLKSQHRPFGIHERLADINTFGLNVQFIYYLQNVEIEMGFFANSYGFKVDFGSAGTRKEEFVSEGGLYLDTRITPIPWMVLEPGIRFHSFPSKSGISVEPRLRGTLQLGENHTLSAAGGLYRQEITGLNNAYDVTDSFTAWLPVEKSDNIPLASHVLVGWEGRLLQGLTLDVEGYLKTLSHVSFTLFSDIDTPRIEQDKMDGLVKGLDVTLELALPAFSASLGYGLSQTYYEPQDPTLGQSRFSPPHDRRHQVNLLFRYARRAYALSARWQLGTGRPFTQSTGFYNVIPIRNPNDVSYIQGVGVPVIAFSEELYTARTPAYHRLDLSLERTLKSRWFTAILQASAINAYNRSNFFDYDFFTEEQVNQFPLIPSLGLKVTF